jgi:hypothetical protein
MTASNGAIEAHAGERPLTVAWLIADLGRQALAGT